MYVKLVGYAWTPGLMAAMIGGVYKVEPSPVDENCYDITKVVHAKYFRPAVGWYLHGKDVQALNVHNI